jgi:hypothetical protein
MEVGTYHLRTLPPMATPALPHRRPERGLELSVLLCAAGATA